MKRNYIPECEDCSKKAMYDCIECESAYCKEHAEQYNYICENHVEPILQRIV